MTDKTEFEIDTNDISSLVELFQKTINLNQTVTMPQETQTATQVLSEKELTFLINLLPEFKPGENLALFINRVDELTNAINLESAGDLYKFMLYQGIKSKIKGDAADFVSYFNCKDWQEIKTNLLTKYGDQRSEQVLLNELDSLSQLHNESFQNFYHRVIATFNALMQKIKLDTTDVSVFNLKRDMYTIKAVNTFRLGVTEPYCSYLDKFSLSSLEECLNKCITYENEKSIKDYHEYMRRKASNQNQKPKPIQRQPLNNFSSHPNFNLPRMQTNFANQATNYRPQNFTNSNVKPFPSQPINIQARPTTQPQKFFTNKQVFGNAAKPIGTTMSKLNRPTPMSVSTTNTKPQNYFKPQSRPTFASQELYNVEDTQQTDETDNDPWPLQNDEYDENQIFEEYSDGSDANFRQEASEQQ